MSLDMGTGSEGHKSNTQSIAGYVVALKGGRWSIQTSQSGRQPCIPHVEEPGVDRKPKSLFYPVGMEASAWEALSRHTKLGVCFVILKGLELVNL